MRLPEPPAPLQKKTSRLAGAVIFHFSSLLIFTTWAFGGQIPWARQVIAIWGSLGVLLFIIAEVTQARSPNDRYRGIRLLWPLWCYNLLVIVGCLNPGFKEITSGGEISLVLADPITWLPSAARPLLAAHELWQFNVIVLSCCNLWLVLRSRRRLRFVLFILVTNAVALAVFGTFQKLGQAKGLWFDFITAPNPKFFATFVYHNHWGAFTLLNTAACLALFFHFLRRSKQRDLWHSPVTLTALAALLLAATVPLSASRSCTVLLSVLLGGALVHLLRHIIQHRQANHESATAPVLGLILAATLAVTAIGYLGADVITQRLQQTAEQLTHIEQASTLNARLTLYRDTWRMAAERPWFDWGLESYAHVFRIFNTQRAAEAWIWITFYAEAHNDWLQSLAEVGFVGTALLGLLLALPLWRVEWRHVQSLVPRYLLTGNSIILLYAWLEFPFANPAVVLTFFAIFYTALRYAQQETLQRTAGSP